MIPMERVFAKWWFVMALLTMNHPAFADDTQVMKMRSYTDAQRTRVVFDLSGPVRHALFTLPAPERVVIDLDRAKIRDGFKAQLSGKLLRRVRYAPHQGGDVRIVLDLNAPVRPKSFPLGPSGRYGHRLVVDLYARDAPARQATSRAVAPPTPPKSSAPPQAKQPSQPPRQVVIAVDAGHGGIDPGASGPSGLREKVVTLQVARRLAKVIDRAPGMRAVLIRDGDYFLKLGARVQRARRAKADLFISIHADAFRDARARGASVYILSRQGASSAAARWLAGRENAADHIGGVRLDDKDDALAEVLLDLSQNGSIEAGGTAAEQVLAQLKRIGPVHKRNVERAAFAVLKSPDIPSMLVEIAFISNPEEERKLRGRQHQDNLAQAILRGVEQYFREHAPPDTWFAAQRKELAQARQAN